VGDFAVITGVDRDPRALLARLRREGVVRSATDLGSGGLRAALPTGVEGLDGALGGGLPRGRIVEVIGPVSSGRTAFLFRVLAAATSRGEQTALIDAADAFDPDAAALAGVKLERLLWVRPEKTLDAFRAADLVLDAGGFGVVAVDRERGSRLSTVDCRLPSPWPRLSLRAERSGSVLLSIGERREAGTFAAVVLGLRRGAARWKGGHAAPLLLERLDVRIDILRTKVGGTAGPVRWVGKPGGATRDHHAA
jgi:hypothetical protein